MSTATYHLWFKPSGAACDVLARTIRELAQQLNSPDFEPHLSLIGNLDGSEQEIIQKTEELGRRLEPFTVALIEPGYRDIYFRCLFMLAEPTAPLLNAYAVACDIFRKPPEEFMPHVSLVYGSYPEALKRSIVAGLPPDVRTTFEVREIILVRADSPDPKDWHEMAASPMKRSSPTVSEPAHL